MAQIIVCSILLLFFPLIYIVWKSATGEKLSSHGIFASFGEAFTPWNVYRDKYGDLITPVAPYWMITISLTGGIIIWYFN